MKKTTKNITMGMSLGICFGVELGVAIDGLGISMGLCLGMLIGLVIGKAKDKVFNVQVEEKGYTIKEITKDDNVNKYNIILTDNQGKEQVVNVSAETMDTEQFTVGDIVFKDEDGYIEQAFNKEDK